jgi:ATP-dependent Lhr-like helicase
MRRRPANEAFVSVSGADPLNLIGLLVPGARLPALTANRVLYRDGIPTAVLAGGEVRIQAPLAPAEDWQARNALVRRHVPAALADFS